MSSKKKRLKRTTGKDGGQHANQERTALKYRLLLESVINDKPTHGIPTSTQNLAVENERKYLMDNLKILHKEGVLKKTLRWPFFQFSEALHCNFTSSALCAADFGAL